MELIKQSDLELEQTEEGVPRIEVGEAILQLTDGRTASQRAAQQCTPNLVLFDYALDYTACSHIGLSAAVQASDQAHTDAIGFFQDLGKQVCVLKDVPGMQVMRTVSMLINEAYDAVNQVCAILPPWIQQCKQVWPIHRAQLPGAKILAFKRWCRCCKTCKRLMVKNGTAHHHFC